MKSSNPALMATPKTNQKWQAMRDHFSLLYRKKPLPEVMRLMQQERNFTASIRQYKDKIRIWGLIKYKKRDKKSQLETGYTIASGNPASAVSSDGDTFDHITSADLSIPPSVKHTVQRRAKMSKMPRLHRQHEADAQDHPSVCNELVPTNTAISSSPEPSRSPTPPIQDVWHDYLHGIFFNANALVPRIALLPVFVDSYDELETMGITMAAQNGSSQAEPASERPGETEVGQSCGSSNKSSGTIDSNPESEYELVEGEILRELYGVFVQQSSH